MHDETQNLLQDILARCAAQAATCLANGDGKNVDYRAMEVRMATSLAHASARLADSIGRLQKNASKRGSNRRPAKPAP